MTEYRRHYEVLSQKTSFFAAPKRGPKIQLKIFSHKTHSILKNKENSHGLILFLHSPSPFIAMLAQCCRKTFLGILCISTSHKSKCKQRRRKATFRLSNCAGQDILPKDRKEGLCFSLCDLSKKSQCTLPYCFDLIKMKLDEGVGYTHKTQQFSNNVLHPFLWSTLGRFISLLRIRLIYIALLTSSLAPLSV